MIAPGAVNDVAMLPGTEGGTMTAVMTEPAIRVPAIGFTRLTVSAATPTGNETLASTGAVVPVAVTTICRAWLPVSAATGAYTLNAPYATFVAIGLASAVVSCGRRIRKASRLPSPAPTRITCKPTLPTPGSGALSVKRCTTRAGVEPVRANPM